MPDSSSADAASRSDEMRRDRLARQSRVEEIVAHLRGLCGDVDGGPDIAAAVDILVDIKIDLALYEHSYGERMGGPNRRRDPRLLELDERCEAARLNLRRVLSELGVGA